MEQKIDVLEMRYTLPGLVYFLVLYICLIVFGQIPLEAERIWVGLGAIALVGSIPAGYLIHQAYLAWSYLNGRVEHYEHMKNLGKLLNRKEVKEYCFKMDGDEFTIDAKELVCKLKKLGGLYLEHIPVWFHRETFTEYGLLTPIHDLIFYNTKIHETYYLGQWSYARITRIFIGSLVLGILPWGIGWLTCLQVPICNAVPYWIILVEFFTLAVIGWLVSGWSRTECDIYEQLFTWLYEMKTNPRKGS